MKQAINPIGANSGGRLKLRRSWHRCKPAVHSYLSPLLNLLVPLAAFAAEADAKLPHWWEVATGIIAIPAAVVGLIYSIVLIKKTRVEVRKTELEIQEKTASLRNITATQSDVARALIDPLIEAKTIQGFVLRFILLFVTLQLWGLAEQGFNFLLGGMFLTLQQFTSVTQDHRWVELPFFVVLSLPKIGEVLILLGLGLPLFRDVANLLGLDLKSVLFFWRRS